MWGKSEEICLVGMECVLERIVRNKVGEGEARCLITINQDGFVEHLISDSFNMSRRDWN